MIRSEPVRATVRQGVPFHHVGGGWLKLTKGCALKAQVPVMENSVSGIVKSVVYQLLLVVW